MLFYLFVTQAARSLLRNKLRSTLAAVGIMIGIAAVVCVVAIGRAGSARSEEEFHKLGDNLVWVEAGSRAPNGVRTGSHGTTTLTLQDAWAILHEIPQIKAVSPQVDGSLQVVYGNKNWHTRYRGVSPDYLEIKRWEMGLGSAFTDEEVRRVASVVVIGQTVREQLFSSLENPIGKIIRVQSQLFSVIGVLAPKGQTAMGQDQDDTVLLPYTTAQGKIRGRGVLWLDDIFCSAVSPQAVAPAIVEITALVRQRHHIKSPEDDDFNIRRTDEVLKAQIETSNTLAILLISIAGISLLVGGIGVMNVMIVSVAERTREIGLRLAVGATQRAVQAQFLGEAVLLSLFGGLLGVLLGIGSSFALGRVLHWSMSIPAQALLLAPAFSIAVGVFFGFYPALRAARLDPIAALRYE